MQLLSSLTSEKLLLPTRLGSFVSPFVLSFLVFSVLSCVNLRQLESSRVESSAGAGLGAGDRAAEPSPPPPPSPLEWPNKGLAQDTVAGRHLTKSCLISRIASLCSESSHRFASHRIASSFHSQQPIIISSSSAAMFVRGTCRADSYGN